MKRLFTYKDGGLKSGKITMILFILILAMCSFIFWLREPVDKILVKVEHVFEPTQEIEKKEKPAQLVKEKATQQTDSRPDSPKKAEKFSKKIPDKNHQVSSNPGESTKNIKSSNNKNQQYEKIKNKLANFFKENGEIQDKNTMQAEVLPSDKKGSSTETPQAVTVSRDKYMELLRSWQKSGKSPDNPIYPLKVANLENTYELLQMKPVAVAGDRLYDLTDGSPIDKKVLSDYTTLVFEVEGAWDKWGEALQKAGLKEDDHPKVRYYMYDFIKNGIYNRVAKAVDWCIKENLLEADFIPSEIDVRGKTYAIKQQGGGNFGVFVPLALITSKGVVHIDPAACFSDQPDINSLQKAGLL